MDIGQSFYDWNGYPVENLHIAISIQYYCQAQTFFCRNLSGKKAAGTVQHFRVISTDEIYVNENNDRIIQRWIRQEVMKDVPRPGVPAETGSRVFSLVRSLFGEKAARGDS